MINGGKFDENKAKTFVEIGGEAENGGWVRQSGQCRGIPWSSGCGFYRKSRCRVAEGMKSRWASTIAQYGRGNMLVAVYRTSDTRKAVEYTEY